MATTRIMPLHVGKGRTESRAISDIIRCPLRKGLRIYHFYFSSLAIRPGCGFYGCCAIVKNVYVISRRLWI